jgi:hypothetical protein
MIFQNILNSKEKFNNRCSNHLIYCFFIFVIATISSGKINAQEFSSGAIKNFGSGAAAIAQCEIEGYMPVGTASEYLKAIQKNSPEISGKLIKQQYQKSLHEKKLYSIASEKWIDFKANKNDCAQMYKAYPSLLNHFKTLNTN